MGAGFRQQWPLWPVYVIMLKEFAFMLTAHGITSKLTSVTAYRVKANMHNKARYWQSNHALVVYERKAESCNYQHT